MEPKHLKALLTSTGIIVENQRKLKALKGEMFNVFSILGMERSENSTHSAFLSELLNPNGTHLKGSIFLQLFLQTIDNIELDVKTAKVKVEEHLGYRDDESKTGGRVDIYIWDAKGKTICIENKIYAGDQFAQIERYYNHNKEQNSVYYLNLHGATPSPESCGSLIAGIDYHIISYKQDIMAWLRLCLKESVDLPIIRETIRQYIILIQKLTSTMDTPLEKDLFNVMLHHYEEANYIAKNFEPARLALCEDIRRAVVTLLREQLAKAYNVERGAAIENHFAQIWLTNNANGTMEFGIETFNGYDTHMEGFLFVGQWDKNNVYNNYAVASAKNIFAKFWINPQKISDYQGYAAHLNDKATLIKINADEAFKQGFIGHIVDETIDYINKESVALRSYIDKAANI